MYHFFANIWEPNPSLLTILARAVSLLEAGVSVIVPRPSKRVTLTPEVQMSMLMRHIKTIAAALRDNPDRLLLKLTEGAVTEISLEQLARETG